MHNLPDRIRFFLFNKAQITMTAWCMSQVIAPPGFVGRTINDPPVAWYFGILQLVLTDESKIKILEKTGYVYHQQGSIYHYQLVPHGPFNLTAHLNNLTLTPDASLLKLLEYIEMAFQTEH